MDDFLFSLKLAIVWWEQKASLASDMETMLLCVLHVNNFKVSSFWFSEIFENLRKSPKISDFIFDFDFDFDFDFLILISFAINI